jgi:hypothetical protein
MDDKFRSIKAFKQFEQRSLSGEAEGGFAAQRGLPGEAAVSPLRVLAALKKHPQGVRRRDLAGEVAVPLPALDEALLHLLKEDLVRVEPGATPGDDLIRP